VIFFQNSSGRPGSQVGTFAESQFLSQILQLSSPRHNCSRKGLTLCDHMFKANKQTYRSIENSEICKHIYIYDLHTHHPIYPCTYWNPELPDGTFLYQKFQLWYNLEELGMELIALPTFGIVEAIRYILCPFGIFCGH
jgi:hypothetical protein